MGCIPSSCWPRGATGSDQGGPCMQGVVLDELGRWKASIELLEKEGRKELKRNAKDSRSSAKGKGSGDGNAEQRAGLRASYKDIKSMLGQGSSGSSDSSESEIAAERRRRGKALQSMTSGEIMVSMDPAVLRKKLLNPPNEAQRQQTVDALKIVQTSQDDPHYENMVSLAAKIFSVPLASIAILDKKRIWIKSIHNDSGLGNEKVKELPREKSFLAHMLLNEKHEVMVVEDSLEDGRFHDLQSNHKTVRFPARFCAAAPLYAPNGYQIGAMLISDNKPRKMDAGSFLLLTNLAEIALRALLKDADYNPLDLPPPADEDASSHQASRQAEAAVSHTARSSIDRLYLHSKPASQLKHVHSLESRAAQLNDRAADINETGIMICNAAATAPNVMLVNETWVQLTGIASEAACQMSLWQIFELQDEAVTGAAVTRAIEEHLELDAEAQLLQGSSRSLRLSFRAAGGNLDQYMPLVGVPSFIEFSQKRDLHYFFVLVRRLENPVATSLGDVGEQHSGLSIRQSAPTEAFEVASAAEPWGTVEVAASQEEKEAKRAALEAMERSLQDKPEQTTTVTLPFNSELFSLVSLGPLLGRGSYGRVHRGVWQGHQIAVKILDTFHQDMKDCQIEDLAEARLMESIVHPNIMQTYRHATRFKESCSAATRMKYDNAISNQSGILLETWLLLEFCNKGSLQDANDRGWFRTEPSRTKGKPDMSIILPTALELAEGLGYLHEQGILHGDLSPGNVLLADEPSAPHGFTVKVADFGLSRIASSKAISTKTFGTVTHMPPELLSEGTLTKAADVYSYGVLLWSMYTGVPAWQGLRRTQVLFKVTALKASLTIPPNCPPFFKGILEQCMQRDHGLRPSFSELVQELRELSRLQQQGIDMDTYAQPVTVLIPPANKWRSLSLGARLARPSMPQVPEQKVPSMLTCQTLGRDTRRKMPALQRRPSFSPQGVQLEVV